MSEYCLFGGKKISITNINKIKDFLLQQTGNYSYVNYSSTLQLLDDMQFFFPKEFQSIICGGLEDGH